MKDEKRKRLVLEFVDALGCKYESDLLNDCLLDQLNLKQEDIKEVKLDFKDMPGYFYSEDIPSLGYTTVAGGSLGFDLITYAKGTYQLQPFLRYDKGHKEGLKTEHLNPKLRVVYNRKEWYLPDKGGVNVFGEALPHIIETLYPIEWKACDPDNSDIELGGKIEKRIKKKPDFTKKVYGKET